MFDFELVHKFNVFKSAPLFICRDDITNLLMKQRRIIFLLQPEKKIEVSTELTRKTSNENFDSLQSLLYYIIDFDELSTKKDKFVCTNSD
jgi:hypothetical protein